MAYGSVLTDTVQSSTAGTPPQFNDGNGTQTGTLCRAWVNFDGTGTVAIRASFNVSSITDNGTGNYTVNFTTAMPDANYGVQVTPSAANSGSLNLSGGPIPADTLTTSVRVLIESSAGVDTNTASCNVSIFR